ncbi:hypothetical protein P170DRAFT_467961 [Aspergillus steynii IBT 23096]|uniref:Uncharacterized protein n=1 Tax=Aspergillus steynii IBT 23096 TaxID=1392250 RepID=A0A2I2FUG0_9EURO|nr:uncharacterized protein P170DRAFT_467961 [Aspergillus steynii IBT 23096]PLB44241.1 hypothetical protein P170DRAFT_467961 [Aspergillus steynii IBT 23096]
MNLLFPLLLLLPILTQAFNLDTHTKRWNYTTSNLASTTSTKCQAAYAAEIKCDGFLVDLVSAHETRTYLKGMQHRDFTNMCTSSCETSLSEYIENVRDACSEPGDAALKSKGFMWINGTENVPVETVGLMFQYMFMRGCARDEHGENCYFQQSAFLPPDFDCDWTCALAYYWTGHFYPYSDWTFGDPELKDFSKVENDVVIGSNYMMQVPIADEAAGSQEDGWKTVKKCGPVGSKESPPFDSGISGKQGDKKSGKASSSAVSSAASGTATSAASTSAASAEAGDGTAAAAATPTETGSAGRIELAMGYFLGAVVLSAYMGF